MRLQLLILSAVLLLSFGCIEEKSFGGGKSEQLVTSEEFDIDEDGIADYGIYKFTPVTVSGAEMKTQRYITVVTTTTATYTEINPNLTDVDLLVADQSLEEFSQVRTQSDTACSNKIGLVSVVCSDVTTCSRLCSAASLKCRNVAETYEDELAGAMISYVQANNELRSLILDSRRMVFELRETTDENRNEFLDKTRGIVARIADINANPLYTHPEVQLCSPSDFGVSYVIDAAKKIGTYRTEATGYHYRVMLSITPLAEKEEGEIGLEVGGVGLTDKVPSMMVIDGEEISSIQKLTAAEAGGYVEMDWTSDKASQEGYLLVYEFESDSPPENVLTSMKTPDVKVRTIDLSGFIPTNIILLMLYGITANYYISLGAALGITVAALLFAYTVITMAITLVSEKIAGATFTTGFRKAFGRTEVRWKSDGVIAVVFLLGGFGASIFVATPPLEPPALMESIGFLMNNGTGAIGVTLMMLGVIMVYFAAENLAKVMVLEKAYGMVMKNEEDAFRARAKSLKEKISQLRQLVDEYSKENFDISQEYDMLTTLQASKVDSWSKEMTARNKTLVDDYLTRVERALGSLQERKKVADENWPKWKETIGKMLDEKDEVYVSALVTIPASLRTWALSKYSEEEGVVLDRDGIKKVKVSPEKVVKEMVSRGLINGAIVIKNEKVVLSEFAEGSGTVVKALALKLRTYLRSLAKNLGQHEPQSFVAIGKRSAMVLMKTRGRESVLFVKKEKFNEAIEQWKAKMEGLKFE